MATPTMEGLKAELSVLEDELEKAIRNNDERRIAVYKEKIRQVENNIKGLQEYKKTYG